MLIITDHAYTLGVNWFDNEDCSQYLQTNTNSASNISEGYWVEILS